jgi:hypothetical protein
LHRASLIEGKGFVSKPAREDENRVALCAGGDSGCSNFSISAKAAVSGLITGSLSALAAVTRRIHFVYLIKYNSRRSEKQV